MNSSLNIKKTLYTVIGLNVVQFSVLLIYIIYSYVYIPYSNIISEINAANVLIILIVLTTLINSFYIIRDARYVINYGSQHEMIISSLHQIEDLNKTLRAQRHDFINHIQVVHSLMEMEEYEDAKDYIEKVFKDIQKVSKSLKTSNPAINALLQAKLLNCEKKDINLILNVSTNLIDLTIPSWEMCRILSNLIDNAIYALNERNFNRILVIDIYKESSNYIFSIEDNGPAIPKYNLNKIFETGFTTKGNKGEGMGLSIANDIIGSYGGSIEVSSKEDKTTFIVKVPVKGINHKK